MNFHNAWRTFINEDIDYELQLLIESKFKDAKAKYPELAERGLIERLKQLITDRISPKGVPKYIMWAAKHLDFQRVHENEAEPFLRNQALVIADSLAFFENNQDRMPEKDINKYKSLASLVADVRQTGASQRQIRKKEKETAIEGSEIVYDENDIFAVRPYTEGASCYYGKNTRWCISATESTNYFNQYTSENKAFVMARFENIPEDDNLRRLTLVYDYDGEFIGEVYVANDDELGREALEEAVATNLGLRLSTDATLEIVDDLISAGSANVEYNPPDATAGFEARAEEIEEEYKDLIKHAYYHYEADEYFYFGGGFEVHLDQDRVDAGEYELPGYFNDRDLENLLSDVGVYAQEIDIGEIDGQAYIRIMLSTDNYESNPDGYESFLDELHDLEAKYGVIERVVEKYLTKEGYMAPSAFDTAEEEFSDLAKSLEYFEMRDYTDTGLGMIVFTNSGEALDTGLPGGEGLLRRIGLDPNGNPYRRDGVDSRSKEKTEELHNTVSKKLQGLNKALMDLAQKQLELPISDLPPKVIEELSIPDNLVISFADTLQYGISVRISFAMDPKITREAIDASVAVIKFMDQRFDEVVQAVKDTLSDMFDQADALAKEKFEAMPEEWQQLYQLMKKKHANSANARQQLTMVDNWLAQKGHGVSPGVKDWFSWMERYLKAEGDIPEDFEMPLVGFNLKDQTVGQETVTAPLNPPTIAEEIEKYFSGVSEEKGRSRQRGIYKFYCMIGYTIDIGENQRGLDDMLADMRALPNVTIVTVVIGNRRIANQRYIAGLSVKFIPSIPGTFNNPETIKTRITREIRRVKNVERIFKVSTSVERIE